MKLISSILSVYFESMPYRLSEETGLIDYEMLEVKAKLYCTVLYCTVLYCTIYCTLLYCTVL